jgi:hypothetical protein
MKFGDSFWAFKDLEYCIDVIAKGNLYKLQSEILLDADSSSEDEKSQEEDLPQEREMDMSISRVNLNNQSDEMNETGEGRVQPGIERLASTISLSLAMDR